MYIYVYVNIYIYIYIIYMVYTHTDSYVHTILAFYRGEVKVLTANNKCLTDGLSIYVYKHIIYTYTHNITLTEVKSRF